MGSSNQKQSDSANTNRTGDVSGMNFSSQQSIVPQSSINRSIRK
jgi:hypothetical protein